jgi:hypothetical protein
MATPAAEHDTQGSQLVLHHQPWHATHHGCNFKSSQRDEYAVHEYQSHAATNRRQ